MRSGERRATAGDCRERAPRSALTRSGLIGFVFAHLMDDQPHVGLDRLVVPVAYCSCQMTYDDVVAKRFTFVIDDTSV